MTIRDATPADAPAVGRLAKEFAAYLRALGDTGPLELSAEAFLRDGFGDNAAFKGLVTEIDGEVVGYLLYHFGYDADNAARNLHIVDLYVSEAARRQGIGKALMEAAAARCRDAGGTELFWSVFRPNALAMAFYLGIGAELITSLDFMLLKLD